MADISIVVDTKSLVDAKNKLTAFQQQMGKNASILGLSRALGSVESNIFELIKAQDKNRLSQRSFNQGLLEQRKALEAMGMSSYMAKKRVDELVAAVRNQEALRRANQAAEEAALATKKLADRQRELRMRFQEGYAQFTRQREAMRSLREAYRSGIITLQQYEQQLARIRAVNQGNVAGTNSLGVAMQQTGYQVGDFIVQIQSGTNPMVALGQQATQLVGVLYLLPPATLAATRTIFGLSVSVSTLVMSLGIIIPIATAIGAYFMRMSASAKNLSQMLDDLKDSSGRVIETLELLRDKELDQKFGSLTGVVRDLSSEMLKLNNAAQLNNLLATLKKLEGVGNANMFMVTLKGTLSVFTLGLYKNMAHTDEFNKLGFDMSKQTYDGYFKGINELAQAGDREGVVAALNEFLADATDNGAELTKQGHEFAKTLYDSAVAAAEVAAELNGSAPEVRRLVAAEEHRVALSELYYENLKKQADLQKEQRDGVTDIVKARDDELASLNAQIELNRTVLKFGKDSTQVSEKQAALERTAYELGEMAKGTKGNNLVLVMQTYDALVKSTKEITDAEKASELLKDALGESLFNALRLGETDLSKGIDKAAEAAKLLAERMGISLGAAQAIVNVASLEDKGGQAFINSPAYDPSNTRIGAFGNQDSREQMSGADWRLRQWQALNPIPKKDKSSSGAVAGRIDTQEEYLAKLAREYDMKKKSLGLTDEQIKRNQFLFTLDEEIATMKTKRTELEIETERKRAIAAYDAFVAAERQDALMGVVNSNINDAFMAMVDGSATVADAFRNMMFNILKSVYEQSVTQPIANGLTGILRGLVGGASGGTGSMGLPMPFANGGVVGSPTTFSMSGGKTGLMGEAGPEAIMPLKRGSNGQLGVQVNGGSGGMTVNNNITVTGSDAAAVRMEVAKMIPQITNATKAAIIDAKKRGGQMGAAFA